METISINRAFSKQAASYDHYDHQNPVLQDMRGRVYRHVSRHLKPATKILELNAGTGIDALHFALDGHHVHATDLSDGMVQAISAKIKSSRMQGTFSCQQLSFDDLEKVSERRFDYVFSNFGGLNCIADLSSVAQHLPAILNPGARLTLVIMPPISCWELLWIFRGRPKAALRRFHKNGVMAHLEGEYFKTYYHSLSDVRSALGLGFQLLEVESLCMVSPPPSRKDIPTRYPRIYKALKSIDRLLNFFPFNRTGDHIIVSFQMR